MGANSPKHNPKRSIIRIAISRQMLYALNRVEDVVTSLADIVRGEPLIEKHSDQYWQMSAASLMSKMHYINNHPCKTCNKIGGVPVGDNDAVACPNCKGFGVEPQALLEKPL